MGFVRRRLTAMGRRLRRLAASAALIGVVILAIAEPTRSSTLALLAIAAALIVLVAILRVGWRMYAWLRPVGGNCRLGQLDRMEGAEFEGWIARVLRSHGFETRNIRHRGDFGVDVIATCPETGRRIAIQAKRYQGSVGNDAVQQAIAGAQFHDCDRSAVVTQSRFTRAARMQAAAADPPVVLIGRSSIRRMSAILHQALRY